MDSNIVFSEKIFFWYHNTKTQDLPWQLNKTIYKVWLSEIMLQQTQVSTVIPYYKKFLEKFETISQLATANLNEVLCVWSGLGYYKRAINLHQTAKIIVQHYNGVFPQDFNTILSFPGIGKSTAGAILSLALNQHYPILDSNIQRILIRYYLLDHNEKKTIIHKKLWSLIELLLPKTNVSIFNQALMNLGRLICTHTNPLCNICPISNDCKAFLTNNINKYTKKKIAHNKITQTIWWVLLWIQPKQTIWLIKRSKEKIWQNLFCFPEFYNLNILNIWLNKHNLHNNKYNHMHLLQHTVSNINLEIHPILIHINKLIKFNEQDGLWYNLNNPTTIGLPKPVSIILNNLHSNKLQKQSILIN